MLNTKTRGFWLLAFAPACIVDGFERSRGYSAVDGVKRFKGVKSGSFSFCPSRIYCAMALSLDFLRSVAFSRCGVYVYMVCVLSSRCSVFLACLCFSRCFPSQARRLASWFFCRDALTLSDSLPLKAYPCAIIYARAWGSVTNITQVMIRK